jgi:Predicted transcriptional regulator
MYFFIIQENTPYLRLDMNRIVNITERGNAAIHALAIAAVCDSKITAAACAARLGLSPSYFAKVLQVLVHAGLLRSTRGPAGGFELSCDPERTSCLAVLEAIEERRPDRACLFDEAVCAAGTCGIKLMCEETEMAARRALESTSIAAIAASFKKA